MHKKREKTLSSFLHYYLAHLAEGMGYDVGSLGDIYGATLGICAGPRLIFELEALTGDIEQFDARLESIWKLIVEKTQDPTKGMKEEERNDIIQSIVNHQDLRAFFDSIVFAYKPDDTRWKESILPGAQQKDKVLISSILASTKLKALGGVRVMDSFSIAVDFDSPNDLNNLCKKLTKIFIKSKVNVVCGFDINNHAVSLNYNPTERKWSFFDINDPPSKTIHPKELPTMLKDSMLRLESKTKGIIGKVTVMTTAKLGDSEYQKRRFTQKMEMLQKRLSNLKEDWYTRTIGKNSRFAELSVRKKTLMHFAIDEEDAFLIDVLAKHHPQCLSLTEKLDRTPLQLLYGKLEKHMPIVIQLINAKPSIINEQGLLHAAVKENCIDLIKFLTENPHCDVNLKNEYGETPLYKTKSVEVIQLLLGAGGKADSLSKHHKPPLTHLILLANKSVYQGVQALLSAGAPLFLDEYPGFNAKRETYLRPEPQDVPDFSHIDPSGNEIRSPLIAAEYVAFHRSHPHHLALLELILTHLFYPETYRLELDLEKKRKVFFEKLEQYSPRLSKRCYEFLMQMIDQNQSLYNFVSAAELVNIPKVISGLQK